ncbi:MAG: glycosyltransferase family 2 protein [Bdellovibrionales bacterium]
MAKFDISVVMPALNEQANLERAVIETVQSFEKLGIGGEIVLINDGSQDETGAIADRLAKIYPFIHVIHHAKPNGIGGSFWEGAHQAQGDVVTMLPGDGENDPIEILRYLPLMKQVDIVVPFVYNLEVRGRSRRWVSRLYKAIINLSFGMLLNYMNGTVMYRRSVLTSLTLKARGFFYQTELLIKAIRMGYLYAEVPYALGTRSTGKSKALTLKSFFRLSRDYLRTVYQVYVSERRTRYEIPPATATNERRVQLQMTTSTARDLSI